MTNLIFELVNLPKEFIERNTVSMFDLLQEKGDFSSHVAEDEIYNELVQHPELVDSWLCYSQDKRSDSGWYFDIKNNKYVVGYYESNTVNEKQYESRLKACAAYIKAELEEMENYVRHPLRK